MSDFWIGASKVTEKSALRWTVGLYLEHVYWQSGKPDSGDKNCVYMKKDSGTWVNHDCSHTYPFVCQGTIGITLSYVLNAIATFLYTSPMLFIVGTSSLLLC